MLRSISDQFWKKVSAQEDANNVSPVMKMDKYVVAHVRFSDLYILAIIDDEMPSLMALSFMYRLKEVLESYFGKVNSVTLRKHFAIVYQLLDEMMDNGSPFNTELSLLKEVIPPPSFTDGLPGWTKSKNAVLPTWGADNSGAEVAWRKRGIKHSTNEVYLDILEQCDAILDAQGKVLQCDVFGEVKADVKLSGMPDLTLVFRNGRIISDVGLHPCVRYKRWEAERIVSFVPPEGKFQLMTYKCRDSVVLPLYVQPQIHFNKDGGSVSVMVGSKQVISTGKNIDVKISIDFSSVMGPGSKFDLKPTYGRLTINETTKIITWEMSITKASSASHLEGKIQLGVGDSVPSGTPVVNVEWMVEGWAVSGLDVDSLSLQNVAYSPFKGVKCLSRSGKFEVRT